MYRTQLPIISTGTNSTSSEALESLLHSLIHSVLYPPCTRIQKPFKTPTGSNNWRFRSSSSHSVTPSLTHFSNVPQRLQHADSLLYSSPPCTISTTGHTFLTTLSGGAVPGDPGAASRAWTPSGGELHPQNTQSSPWRRLSKERQADTAANGPHQGTGSKGEIEKEAGGWCWCVLVLCSVC